MIKPTLLAITAANAMAITLSDETFTTDNKGDTCWLKADDRPLLEIAATCPDGFVNELGACYEAAPSGFTCVGPQCI